MFRVHDGDNTRSNAIALLAHWKPHWLDALAAQEGVPNARQVHRIRDLHGEIVGSGAPDLENWCRGSHSGAIEGWVGGVWIAISADGEAVG